MARLPILMYHHVISKEGKDLVISEKNLEKQFKYLSESGYRSYHFRELLGLKKLPKGKNIIITFDDCYVSHRDLALPLLKKYNLKATFFAPLEFLGKKDSWNTSELPILSVEELKNLDPKTIELGFHSYKHLVFSELSNEQTDADTQRSVEFVERNELNFSPVIAYPYGKFPREKAENTIFNETLARNGIRYGLRIGNRINKFPFKRPYEINRLDIKGEWSLLKFKQKIRFGKLF